MLLAYDHCKKVIYVFVLSEKNTNMKTAENAYREVKRLEQKGLISLKWIRTWLVLIAVVFISLFLIWSVTFPKTNDEKVYDHAKVKPMLKYNKKAKQWYGINSIHISMVITCPVCSDAEIDDKLDSVVCTLKSVYVFSMKIVHFHLFADDAMYNLLLEELETWSPSLLHRVTFTFKPVYGSEAPDGFNMLTAPLAFYYLDELMVVEPGTIFTDFIDPVWEDFVWGSKHGSHFIATTLQKTSSKVCKKTQYVTTDQMILDDKVVIFNLKKLRKVKITAPSSLHNTHFNGDNFEFVRNDNKHYNWTAKMTSKFQSMLSNEQQKDDKLTAYIFNLISFFNPKIVKVLKENLNNFNLLTFENKTRNFIFYKDKNKDKHNNNIKKFKSFLRNTVLDELDHKNIHNFLKYFYKLLKT